jgi:uncharacterized membrane protein YoaK (UPF0700 family)
MTVSESAKEHTSSASPRANGEDRHDRLMLALMMALTFAAGVVDAVGYLALDHVFIGNMTGNIVILGMAVAGGNELPITGPLAALICFTLGAAISGLVLRRKPARWTWSITLLLLGAGLLVASTAVVDVLTHSKPSSQAQLLMSSLAAVAMGIQAFVARKLAVKEVTTVVVTSTLTALAGELFTTSARRALLNRRSSAILLILLGATTGALLLLLSTAWALAATSAILALVAVVGHWSTRKQRSHR